jgi:hypothetical protein
MSKLSELVADWRSRREGRRHVPNNIGRQARDVTGALGFAYSRAWDLVATNGDAYTRSFGERRMPPSLHVSNRDRLRAGLAVPLPERCIEDFAKPATRRARDWSTHELNGR